MGEYSTVAAQELGSRKKGANVYSLTSLDDDFLQLFMPHLHPSTELVHSPALALVTLLTAGMRLTKVETRLTPEEPFPGRTVAWLCGDCAGRTERACWASPVTRWRSSSGGQRRGPGIWTSGRDGHQNLGASITKLS